MYIYIYISHQPSGSGVNHSKQGRAWTLWSGQKLLPSSGALGMYGHWEESKTV